MNKNYLTIHSLIALPWHNLNRDDRGLPKQMTEGGVVKGVLSAQSQKRAMRTQYELAVATEDHKVETGSKRSKLMAAEAVKRAGKMAIDLAQKAAKEAGRSFDEKSVIFNSDEARKRAEKAISALVKKPETGSDKKKKGNAKQEVDGADAEQPVDANGPSASADSTDVAVWLGDDEINSLAKALLNPTGDIAGTEFILKPVGSLAIAAFGRMFAKAPTLQTEAAIAVGSAITTHAINLEVDYFTTKDDLTSGGAAFLGQAFYTSGVYYRTVTIDKAQLKRTWAAWKSTESKNLLTELVRALVLALPDGKNNSTAPKTLPSLILAETQQHRVNYAFASPVPAAEVGGYLQPSMEALINLADIGRKFDKTQFGGAFVSGTALGTPSAPNIPFEHKRGDLSALVDYVISWLCS